MKQQLEVLARELLAHSDMPGDFDGEDLVNVLCILQHVAHSIAWTYQNNLGFTSEQRLLIAEEFGKNLRQSVTLFTGIDPRDAVRGESWPQVVTEDV